MRTAFLWFSSTLLLLSACTSPEQSGPGKVRWDRDVCERCTMVLSDWRFAVRVRSGEDARHVYGFDDIGCAVIWLAGQTFGDHPDTEIWVKQFSDGEWLDATQSYFEDANMSPMGYNLSARSDRVAGALDYEGAVRRILEIESRDRIHGQEHAHTSPTPINEASQ